MSDDDDLKLATRILQAILEADERGQGTPFAEAMLAAAVFVAEQRRRQENLREFWNATLGAYRP